MDNDIQKIRDMVALGNMDEARSSVDAIIQERPADSFYDDLIEVYLDFYLYDEAKALFARYMQGGKNGLSVSLKDIEREESDHIKASKAAEVAGELVFKQKNIFLRQISCKIKMIKVSKQGICITTDKERCYIWQQAKNIFMRSEKREYRGMVFNERYLILEMPDMTYRLPADKTREHLIDTPMLLGFLRNMNILRVK